MSEEKTNIIPIATLSIIAVFIFLVILGNSNSNNDGQFDCSSYQNELKKIANTPEDLIETHRITGVIKQIDEDEKYYVIIINPALWKQTTAEQRQLIRCSTTEIASKKGKKGGIVDPIKMERLY